MTTAVGGMYEAIHAVDVDAVPVLTNDRHIPRKVQAAMARQLFKGLGIVGISVTTPRYSMASTVDIAVPSQPVTDADFVYEGKGYHHNSYSDMPTGVPAKMRMAERHAAELQVRKILAKAFPKHDDRSDSQSDYFDAKWSFSS